MSNRTLVVDISFEREQQTEGVDRSRILVMNSGELHIGLMYFSTIQAVLMTARLHSSSMTRALCWGGFRGGPFRCVWESRQNIYLRPP